MPPAAAMVTMLSAFAARYAKRSQALAIISGLPRCMFMTSSLSCSGRVKNRLRIKSRLRVIERDQIWSSPPKENDTGIGYLTDDVVSNCT